MLYNSKGVALLVASAVSIITTLSLLFFEGVPPIAYLLVWSISFVSAILLTYFGVQKLIFNQIEKIHNRINKLKAEEFTFIEEDLKASQGNPLNKINMEILAYAQMKQREIEELKKAEAFRREFIADISHELKTPIFAAQGFVHTLLDGAIKDKNVRNKFLKKAAKSLDGLDRIVEDLVTISEMETGVIKMEMEHFNVNELIQEVFDQFEEKADKKEITMQFKPSCPENVYVYADRQKIYQVLINLVSNAIKYKKDEPTVIEANIKIQEKTVDISIRDNGIGIPREHINRIFERFYRIDKSRSREKGGTGLGLSIVKHILEGHKSQIRVRSKPGKGSVFSFRLQKGRPYNWV